MTKLNLTYYSGKDQYSDGDIEEELLSIVAGSEDIECRLANDNRWPILYHLSSIRHNIVNWYPFKANSSVLEVGGGCGAVTGALCKACSKVIVVELSRRRSLINQERNKEFQNLEIVVGNLNDIEFEEKFDYITLIGVLEYAGGFTNSASPYVDFLKNIRHLLKDEGKLLIAIENRYGLKYFSGAREDHTAQFFDGITGYKNNKSVRTFGKCELEELLRKAGFSNREFYYPHPDYKMPLEIFSADKLPKSFERLQDAPNYDHDKAGLFDLGDAYEGIIENGQFEFFANSFFIECGE